MLGVVLHNDTELMLEVSTSRLCLSLFTYIISLFSTIVETHFVLFVNRTLTIQVIFRISDYFCLFCGQRTFRLGFIIPILCLVQTSM